MLDDYRDKRITNDEILKAKRLMSRNLEQKEEEALYQVHLPILSEVKSLLKEDVVIDSLYENGKYTCESFYGKFLSIDSCMFSYNGFLIKYNALRLKITILVVDEDELRDRVKSQVMRFSSFLWILWSLYFVLICLDQNIQAILLLFRAPLFLTVVSFLLVCYMVAFSFRTVQILNAYESCDYTGR